MATEITNDTPKYLTWREVLQALLDGKTVQAAARQNTHIEKYWYEINPENNFSILHKSNVVYRIKPKPKVKKWRWVFKDNRGNYGITLGHFADSDEYNKYMGTERGKIKVLQKIESTMIEVEE